LEVVIHELGVFDKPEDDIEVIDLKVYKFGVNFYKIFNLWVDERAIGVKSEKEEGFEVVF